jgi:hypothetical protein
LFAGRAVRASPRPDTSACRMALPCIRHLGWDRDTSDARLLVDDAGFEASERYRGFDSSRRGRFDCQDSRRNSRRESYAARAKSMWLSLGNRELVSFIFRVSWASPRCDTLGGVLSVRCVRTWCPAITGLTRNPLFVRRVQSFHQHHSNAQPLCRRGTSTEVPCDGGLSNNPHRAFWGILR